MLELLPRLRTAQPRILVVGDIMHDRYTFGAVERVSPEAPVLVLRASHEEQRLGGAGSVASLLRELGAEVSLLGILGQDSAADQVCSLARQARIDVSLVASDATRPTTVKERFLGGPFARQPQQVLRVDRETTAPVSGAEERQLLEAIRGLAGSVQAVLIADYGKGVCTPAVVRQAIAACRQAGVPILIDPARGVPAAYYSGATIFKPNRLEAHDALKSPLDSAEEARRAAAELRRQGEFKAVVLTLDEDGMVLATAHEAEHFSPFCKRNVCDITGAGDMALATLGFCLAEGVDLRASIDLAIQAAELQIECLGVSGVTWDQIEQDRRRGTAYKVMSLAQLEQRVAGYRRDGKRIVFTNGCFDLLHVGHVSYLQEAAQLGDLLIVAINSDSSVRQLKGSKRPIIRQQDRAAMLAALECVAHVLLFEQSTPHAILQAIRPDVLVKGGTYSREEVVGHEIVTGYGGEVQVLGLVAGLSTSSIVAAIQSQ